eukprot:6693540-Lingulodinium_polyedra.AAC.1
MTVTHPNTAAQPPADSPSKNDGCGERAASGNTSNTITCSADAAKAADKAVPSVMDKLTGMAFCVPTC